jgi:hypothetical protein
MVGRLVQTYRSRAAFDPVQQLQETAGLEPLQVGYDRLDRVLKTLEAKISGGRRRGVGVASTAGTDLRVGGDGPAANDRRIMDQRAAVAVILDVTLKFPDV